MFSKLTFASKSMFYLCTNKYAVQVILFTHNQVLKILTVKGMRK